MLVARLLCLLVALAVCAEAMTQQQTASPSQPIASVSFELFHNRVYLPVEVNGHRIAMVLDTGAAVNGLSETSAKSLALDAKGKAQLKGNGESNLKIGFAKDVTFRIGGAELVEKSVAIIPFEDLESREGRAIAGVLGVDLFRRYVVVIDYAGKTLQLYEPENFVYRGAGEIVPLRLNKAALFHASVTVPGHDPVAVELAVDSGTYSALRMYRPFVQKHPELEIQNHVFDSFDFGIGGEFPEKLGRVGALEIGKLKLAEPVVSFSEAKGGATTSGAFDGTIGGAVLRRFKVILDYPHRQMVLEPNAEFAGPFEADTSGLMLKAIGPDFATISVEHVFAGTPAAAAGVKQEDVIVSVNGQDAKSLGLEGMRRMFCQSGVYRLQLRRAGQNVAVEMRTEKGLY